MNRRAVIKQKRQNSKHLFQRARPKYRLTDMLAQSPTLPILEDWENMPAVGLEIEASPARSRLKDVRGPIGDT